jgi:hypothetical protein
MVTFFALVTGYSYMEAGSQHLGGDKVFCPKVREDWFALLGAVA